MNQQILKSIQTHKKMVAQLEQAGIGTIEACAKLIIDTFAKGGTVFICGNGGSAADAQHIAAELVGRFTRERKGLPAIALTTDSSIITAIANDYGYESVFARQVEAFVKENDLLWAISTSGSSANVLSAVKLAKDKKAKIIAFTGRKNSLLEKISDVCLCAESETSAPSQEIHQLAYHIICDIVENNFCENKQDKPK